VTVGIWQQRLSRPYHCVHSVEDRTAQVDNNTGRHTMSAWVRWQWLGHNNGKGVWTMWKGKFSENVLKFQTTVTYALADDLSQSRFQDRSWRFTLAATALLDVLASLVLYSDRDLPTGTQCCSSDMHLNVQKHQQRSHSVSPDRHA